MKVAQTILNQLGGNRFIAMTGSKQFIAGENFLRMRLSRNKSCANMLKISLNSLDTYDLEFLKVAKNNFKTVKTVRGVYNDMLQDIFTSETGLYTKF